MDVTTDRGTRSPADTWPWRCLGCPATIYHDGWYCAECRRCRGRAPGDRSSGPSFGAWMRDQTYPSFVTAVTSLAGIEVSLTSLWLVLFR